MSYSLIDDARNSRESYDTLPETGLDVIPGAKSMSAPLYSHFLGQLLYNLQDVAEAARAVGGVAKLKLQNTFTIELDLLGREFGLEMLRMQEYIPDKVRKLAIELENEVDRFNSAHPVALSNSRPAVIDVEVALAKYIEGWVL